MSSRGTVHRGACAVNVQLTARDSLCRYDCRMDSVTSAQVSAKPSLRAVLASPKMLAILVLAAASGYPNQLTESALQAWLKDSGETNTAIGVMSYVAIPYLLKFLWAPLVDRYPIPI